MTILPTTTLPDPPLAEVPENGLEQLMLTDPADLTEDQIATLVDHLRAERHKWLSLEAQGKVQKKPKEKLKAAAGPINLDDLGL